MTYVKDNLKVSISYTVRDARRKILEEIPDGHPFSYIHGFNNIIPGLEKALEGKTSGERFVVEIPYIDAYGPFQNDLIIEVPKEELTDVGELWLGMELEMQRDNDFKDFQIPRTPEEIFEDSSNPNELEIFVIKEIRETSVILDGNHPFAGKDLIFEVHVIKIEEPTFSELETGFPDELYEDEFEDDDFDKNSKGRWF